MLLYQMVIMSLIWILPVEAMVLMRKFRKFLCLSSSWNPIQTISSVDSITICICKCQFMLGCTAVKYLDSDHSCQLGNTIGLDNNITGIASNFITDILVNVEGGVGQMKLLSFNSFMNLSPDQVVDLSLFPKKCKSSPNYPITLTNSNVATSPSGWPVACGGYPPTSACYILTSNGWSLHSNMMIMRNKFGFAVNNFLTDPLYAALGTNDDSGSSIEFYNQSSTTWSMAKVRFPFVIQGNCARFINSSTVFNTGGQNWNDSIAISDTFFVTSTTLNRGPPMKTPREMHGCSRILRNSTSTDFVMIVAGGFTDAGNITDSVEIFDPESNEWRDGVPLPFPIGSLAMTEDSLGGVVIAGGATITNSLGTSYILHLPHAGPDVSWLVLAQTLTGQAKKNSAIGVANSLGVC